MRVTQPIATWLAARPLHAVLGLAFTLLLPLAPLLTGAVMVFIVLRQGALLSALQGLAAAILVGAMAMLTGSQATLLLLNAVAIWLPATLAALLLRQTRSLTLTVQVSAIVAMAGTVALYAALGDPTEFWTRTLSDAVVWLRASEFAQQADWLDGVKDSIAPRMTLMVVLVVWSLVALVLALGNAVYQALPGEAGRFGRFCDLNLGRVLALTMAVTSVVAVISGTAWLLDFAFVSFVVFWIQGLALLHWLHGGGILPIGVLIVVYAALLLIFLAPMMVTALAVLGYTDAWFDYRSRVKLRGAR